MGQVQDLRNVGVLVTALHRDVEDTRLWGPLVISLVGSTDERMSQEAHIISISFFCKIAIGLWSGVLLCL